MALLNDVLEWSVSELKPWQQDALRRLFLNDCTLTDADVDELYELMKVDNGLVTEASKHLKPQPLTAEHMPAKGGANTKVALKKLFDLEHVNRLASRQTLEFEPSGLTIVFGGNGSGKSGYSRVLKRACRARDAQERVHPNASDPAAANRTPTAKFELVVGTASKQLAWQHDKASPEELSSIAVFDSRCARVFLDDEREAAFLPYGLDFVQALGQRAYASLAAKLKGEIASQNKLIELHEGVVKIVCDQTKVGQAIATAIEKLDLKQLQLLSKKADGESGRLAELRRALGETDPTAKAKALQGSAKRINAFVERVKLRAAIVDVKAVDAAQRVDKDFVAAEAANKLAINKFQAGEELLAGTGESAWKKLFEAAESFSTQAAYPKHAFPHTGSGAKCVLCQRMLDQDTAKRFTRFHEFVQDTTTTQFKRAASLRTEQAEGLARADLDFGLDEPLSEELSVFDQTIVKKTEEYQASCKVRQQWLGSALKTHQWDNCPALTANPESELTALASKQLAAANALVALSAEDGRKKMVAECAEYEAILRLAENIAGVVALVEARINREALRKCERSVNTTAVSLKSKELTSKSVTDSLRKALDEEFNALGIGHINTKLKEKSEKGKVFHSLVLNISTTLPLNEVLSEGEQRAIAIASFLAELRAAAHFSGIVFDDPVSSLDHNNRAIVAKRLAIEATSRQVIIFTHDAVFLNELQSEAELHKLTPKVCYLELDDDGKFAGVVKGGLPWEQAGWKQRVAEIRAEQQRMAKKWSPVPNNDQRKLMRDQYDQLRATCERVIETILFNDVIRRFDSHIKVGKLLPVGGLAKQECEALQRLWQKCCDVVKSHDPASAAQKPVPTPTDLANDLNALEVIVAAVQSTRP